MDVQDLSSDVLRIMEVWYSRVFTLGWCPCRKTAESAEIFLLQHNGNVSDIAGWVSVLSEGRYRV